MTTYPIDQGDSTWTTDMLTTTLIDQGDLTWTTDLPIMLVFAMTWEYICT